MICPSCGDSETRPSQHTYWSDLFQRMLGREPYRCRKCRLRFYSSETPSSDVEGAKHHTPTNRSNRELTKVRRRRLLRALIAIAIFAAMFVVFLILLKYLTADKASQKDSRTVRPTVVKSLGKISNGQDIQGDFAVYFSII